MEESYQNEKTAVKYKNETSILAVRPKISAEFKKQSTDLQNHSKTILDLWNPTLGNGQQYRNT